MQIILTEQEYNELKAKADAEKQVRAAAEALLKDYTNRLTATIFPHVKYLFPSSHLSIGPGYEQFVKAWKSVPLIPENPLAEKK